VSCGESTSSCCVYVCVNTLCLFLIYRNDLSWMFESALPILFADDTTVVISHANFDSLMNEANDVLLYIAKWFQMNKLSLNIEKSNYIVFRNKNIRYLKEDAKLFINNVEINQVSVTKFLGVYR